MSGFSKFKLIYPDFKVQKIRFRNMKIRVSRAYLQLGSNLWWWSPNSSWPHLAPSLRLARDTALLLQYISGGQLAHNICKLLKHYIYSKELTIIWGGGNCRRHATCVDFVLLLILVCVNFWSGCTNFLMRRQFGGCKYALVWSLNLENHKNELFPNVSLKCMIN